MRPFQGSGARAASVCLALGALAAAKITPQLDDHFVEMGAPVPELFLGLAVTAAVTALAPMRWSTVHEIAQVSLAALRLMIAMVLMLTWKVNGREFWGALVVWMAIHDAWRGVSARAPLAPVALAVSGVLLWTSSYTRVAPGSGVLVSLVAGSAAVWGAERRTHERRRLLEQRVRGAPAGEETPGSSEPPE
jgi:hypothetical protein